MNKVDVICNISLKVGDRVIVNGREFQVAKENWFYTLRYVGEPCALNMMEGYEIYYQFGIIDGEERFYKNVLGWRREGVPDCFPHFETLESLNGILKALMIKHDWAKVKFKLVSEGEGNRIGLGNCDDLLIK